MNATAMQLLGEYPEALAMYETGRDHIESQVFPDNDLLAGMWNEYYNPESNTQGISGVLGVIRQLDGDNPDTLISVDLCDVVRTTCGDFMDLGGFTTDDAGESYGYGLPFGIGEEPDVVVKIVQGLMTTDSVGPVDGIDEIKTILQSMRNRGAFILANTSTLQGCEPSTLRFMRKHLENSFDGIVLPRNHDGEGKITKGVAKALAIAELEALNDDTNIRFTQHIDDAAHHIFAAREAAKENPKVIDHFDATPEYIWNQTVPGLNLHPTPLEAFQSVEEHFTNIRSRHAKI